MEDSKARIELIPITLNDTSLIVKWRNNENVRRNFIFQEKFTEEIHTNWMKTKVETGEVVQFIIQIKENKKKIGSIYFRDINYDKKEAEMGIFIGEDDERGKGYGNEASRLALNYAFDELGLESVYARQLASNEVAIKNNEKTGFVTEKYVKNAVKINGIDRDVIFIRITNKEWKNK